MKGMPATREQDAYRFAMDKLANDARANDLQQCSVEKIRPSKRAPAPRSHSGQCHREIRAQRERLPALLLKNPLELNKELG